MGNTKKHAEKDRKKIFTKLTQMLIMKQGSYSPLRKY